MKQTTLLISLIMISNVYAGILGVFPRVSKVMEDQVLGYYSHYKIKEFIKSSSYDGHKCNDHYHNDFSKLENPNSENVLTSDDLATAILTTSNALGIDAGIYASLIYKESQFCNFGGTIFQKGKVPTNVSRASSTGAQGLTMFTSIAVKGINDQLFNTSRKYFHFKVRPKLHRAMFQLEFSDTNPAVEQDASYYKNKVSEKDKLYQTNPKTKTELKKPSQWKAQILYGAILLKINLSKRSQPESFTAKNSVTHYRKAVENYNGADFKQRTEYWNFIFAVYNDHFNEDFKATAKSQGISFKSPKWEKCKKSFK